MDQVLLIGKPNSGKSLLFNRLTGLNQKVANFPGVTVEVKNGEMDGIKVIDFPGLYTLDALTKDEEVAIENLRKSFEGEHNKKPSIVCILDATRLERSLVLGLQVQELAAQMNCPLIFVINMMDVILSNKINFNLKELENKLGSKIIPISARSKVGLVELKQSIKEMVSRPESFSATSPSEIAEMGHVKVARDYAQKWGPKGDVILKNQGFLDKIFLSGFMGGVVFFIIMAFLFQAIFTWSVPAMDFIEEVIGQLGTFAGGLVSHTMLKDFIQDAIFGGLGSFLVFVPQIFVLTFIIGILEDSGYLARAAIICHKPFSFFGLNGRSFVPFLSGYACSIPAVMATRTIESSKKRLLTIFTIPLMVCSARLPVYALLVTAFIPNTMIMGGLFNSRGMVFFGLYLFGILTALIVSAVLSKTTFKKESDSPFLIELPPYRVPHWKPLIQKALTSSMQFVAKAGLMIFSVTVVIWILGYFPNGADQLETSWLAWIGQKFEWFFKPLELDWKYGVAIIVSFLAREVFVGTLGTMFGIEGADENIAGLADNITASGMSLGAGISLIIFYSIALQCVSTLAVIKKETGSLRFVIYQFLFYMGLAYLLSWIGLHAVNYFF
ncbi:MAG: ferrous iron transporter B [Bacteriovoracaceae bacterium]